jgi:phospholipid N-methyltransferase
MQMVQFARLLYKVWKQTGGALVKGSKARLMINAHMQAKMQQMFGCGYDSGDIEKGLDDPLILQEFRDTGANYKVIFDELIKPRLLAGRTLLEIGPGKGSWTKAVLDNFPHGTLYAIDRLPLGPMIRQRCPSAGDRLRFVQTYSNDYSVFPDNLFDFVFSFGVFVHLPLREIETLLTRLRPKICRGGEVILQYSNWHKLDKWGWERARVPTWFRDNPNHPDVWWTKNSCATMRRVSERSGYTIVSLDLGYFQSCSVLHLKVNGSNTTEP